MPTTAIRPRVSIITICRNEEARIRETAESVAKQTVADLEWIVIDGQSTDGTLKILEDYQPKIAFLQSVRDSGVYAAQNRGASLATGDFLLFLNGGDSLASPMAIEWLLAESGAVDLVYGDLIAIDENGDERLLRAPEAAHLDHMMRDTIWHPTALIRADLFRRLGPYDETFRIVADYDFFLRALTHGRAQARHCARAIAHFHTDGLSSRPENQIALATERRRAQNACLSPLIVDYWEARANARLSRQAGHLVRACLVKAVCLAPNWVQRGVSRLASLAHRSRG